jgi:hypothetical protein
MTQKYWINTVSQDHVLAGVAGGFTQADHGRSTTLKKAAKGVWLVFYSPRTSLHEGEPLQQFTAIGRITDDEPYQVEMSPDFHPWRRRVEFLDSKAAEVRPLIPQLEFITDKQHWGFPFRLGLFAVSRTDFARMAQAMQANFAE